MQLFVSLVRKLAAAAEDWCRIWEEYYSREEQRPSRPLRKPLSPWDQTVDDVSNATEDLSRVKTGEHHAAGSHP